MNESDFMRRAIDLAKGGIGKVNPNPLVGAVIVKEGVIIGEGFHERFGDFHAERNAIINVKRLNKDTADILLKGSTMYVTLEPCCHQGKQPPCTDAIIEAGISKVIIGSRDPNPLVSGKGVKALRQAGIEVVEDFLQFECDDLNPVFFHYIKTKTPYIAIKYAMTADGKIATKKGDSKWVTGESARDEVQQLRNKYRAILIGKGTALADNPTLNCRIPGGRNPFRLIIDPKLEIVRERDIWEQVKPDKQEPPCENLFSTMKEIPTCFVCSQQAYDVVKQSNSIVLSKYPMRFIITRSKRIDFKDENGDHFDYELDLNDLVKILGQMEIDSVLVEGGGFTNGGFLEKGLVNKIYAFIAPKILGCGGIEPFMLAPEKTHLSDTRRMSEATEFRVVNIHQTGSDIVIEMIKR